MERVLREQPMVEDVEFIPVVKQMGVEYRGFEGGAVEPADLPVDTKEGILVSTMIPEGFYAEPAVKPVVDEESL